MKKSFCDLCGKELSGLHVNEKLDQFDLCPICASAVRNLFTENRGNKILGLASVVKTLSNEKKLNFDCDSEGVVVDLTMDDLLTITDKFDTWEDETKEYGHVTFDAGNGVVYRAFAFRRELECQ